MSLVRIALAAKHRYEQHRFWEVHAQTFLEADFRTRMTSGDPLIHSESVGRERKALDQLVQPITAKGSVLTDVEL